MTVHDKARVGFGRAVDAYERARPGYPSATLQWLTGQLGLRAGCTVIDLGAGTGRLAVPLAATGARVVAVDPVAAMLAAIPAVGDQPIAAAAATAQQLPFDDRSVDAVTVAQAFHWFASHVALAEMTRVLRPAGAIALVWNRRVLDDPLQAAIEQIIAPYRGETPSHASQQWRDVVDTSPDVALTATHAEDHTQQLDVGGVVDRVLSTSFIAALDDAPRRQVAAAIAAAARAVPGELVLRYRCEAYLLHPVTTPPHPPTPPFPPPPRSSSTTP